LRDLDRIVRLYVEKPPAQRDALQRYFVNVSELYIEFGSPEISFTGDTASATLLLSALGL